MKINLEVGHCGHFWICSTYGKKKKNQFDTWDHIAKKKVGEELYICLL